MSSSQSSLTRRSVSSRQNFGDGANNKVDDTLYTRGGDAASDFAIPRVPSQLYGKNDGSDNGSPFSIFGTNVTTAILPSWTGLFVKSFLGMTVALYVLNQKHMLPKPLAAIVSKALFWPTLPITASRRIGTWTTVVDETVMIGGAPIGFAGIPERLYEDYGVRGVVNMCKEYPGPTRHYKKLGMTELWLPTVDHFEPSVQDLKTAVSFIQDFKEKGDRVYVHCRAGHGRSAAVVLAYLLAQDPQADAMQLNAEFCKIRNVRKTLWRQSNIKQFHSWLKSGGKLHKVGTGSMEEKNKDLELTVFSDNDSDSSE